MLNEIDQRQLATWVYDHVAACDQFDTYWAIRDLCRDHPEIEVNHSWPELRTLAERS